MYAVDVDERLVGVCSLRMLVISRPKEKIRDIMEREVVRVTADTDQEDVAEIVDPRPFARGELAQAYSRFPHLGPVLAYEYRVP